MDRGFVVKSDRLLRILKTPCFVSESFDPAEGELACGRVEFEALWDTGAGTSLITQRIVNECGLKPIRNSKLQSVSGVQKTEVYLVNIYLPGDILFCKIPVVRGDFSHGRWDMIIGMDVIGIGDFSVKNRNSTTEFSFTVPSQEKVDATSMHPISRAVRKLRQPAAAWLQELRGR
jgi:hypothetical protein